MEKKGADYCYDQSTDLSYCAELQDLFFIENVMGCLSNKKHINLFSI